MLLIWPGQLLDDPCNSDIRLGQKTMLPKVSLLVSSKFKGAMSGYLVIFYCRVQNKNTAFSLSQGSSFLGCQ